MKEERQFPEISLDPIPVWGVRVYMERVPLKVLVAIMFDLRALPGVAKVDFKATNVDGPNVFFKAGDIDEAKTFVEKIRASALATLDRLSVPKQS